MANTRAQVNKVHLAGNGGDRVNDEAGQVKACLPVNFGCERLVIVQLVWVRDGMVVHLDSQSHVEYV